MASGAADILLSATVNTAQSATSPGEMYRSRVWQDLRKLLQQDHLTNVMLAAEGRSLPCHKVLLSAASKFFHDKFITNPESLEHNILDIKDVDFDTLTTVVAYIYSGNIELTVEKTEKLLPASVSLMLPELTKECKNFLGKRNTDMSDCIAVYNIAKANSLDNAARKAWGVMLDHFQDIITTLTFKQLSEAELKEYIGADGLNVPSEDIVFEAVVTWVRHDIQNRKDRLESLLEHVTLSHCSVAFLKNVVMQEPLMKNVNGLQHVAEALASQAMSHSLHLGTPRKMQPNHSSLIAIYNTREGNKNSLQCLLLRGGNWLKKTPTRGDTYICSGVSISTVKDAILTTGERNKKLSLPTMDCTVLSDLNVPRCNHASVCVSGQAYVLGGRASDYTSEEFKSVEYLDVKTGYWCLTADMPVALYGHTAVNYKQYIYVFGGYVESEKSRACFIFDTVTKMWSRKADIPQYCTNGCSVVYRDRIYVFGGGNTCFMSYNPGQDQWEPLSRPRENLTGESAVVWGDRILLCRGRDTTVIEEYNPHTDTWAEWKHSLPKPHCLAVLAVQL